MSSWNALSLKVGKVPSALSAAAPLRETLSRSGIFTIARTAPALSSESLRLMDLGNSFILSTSWLRLTSTMMYGSR
jgi:hypothetical protein